MARDNSIEDVEKVLGNPVLLEFSTNALAVRRNLLIISFIVLFMEFGGISLAPESSIFGLKFVGLDPITTRLGLFIFTVYFLLHFFWYALDAFYEWRVRVTGTRVAFVTTGMWADSDADYPKDPRQSTLYNWWLVQAKQIGWLSLEVKRLDGVLARLDEEFSSAREKILKGADHKNFGNVVSLVAEAKSQINKLQKSIDTVQEIDQSKRIPISLRRFDRSFEFFLRSQNLRWLLIDTLIPIFLGVTAIKVLIFEF